MALCLLPDSFAAAPTFHPDVVFKGSSLGGWHTLGQATWKASDGEITGSAKDGGGWLVLDHSFQDAAFYTSLRCPSGCKAGLLLRAEKTSGGMKGIFVSLAEGEIASYQVTLDEQGKILTRKALYPAGGQMRIAPLHDPSLPPPPPQARRRSLPAVIPPAVTQWIPNEWNSAEVIIDANIVRTFINNGPEAAGGVANDDAGKYGPIALYVGAGEAQFKEVSYKNVRLKVNPPEQTSAEFRKQRLSDFYYAWGAAAADVNHDGIPDVIAGPYYYLGPDYRRYEEIYPGVSKNPSDDYTHDCWMQFAGDFNGDGWPDSLTASFSDHSPGVWLYVNPKGESRRWDKYLVVKDFQSEIAVLRDVDGDGKPELVYMADGYVRYAKPDPANPTGLWTVHTISEKGFGTAHGIGVGDVNGDGRMDILNAFGWWEQPAKDNNQEPWKYHPQAFSRTGRSGVGGSVMGVYDVNGDGLNDVVTVLQAHGFGLAWFEQKKDKLGNISFVEHMIADDFSARNAGGVSFSEAHGTAFGDVDRDGVTDFIVGKRYWTHRDDYYDPDPYGEPVLYWYKTVRDPNAPGGARFEPHLIDNHSGAGSDILATDLNNDGALDVVTATRFGTFIFWGKQGSKSLPAGDYKP
ncbi:MAG: FG-GAP-like repeat-containing protein [Edaphobacter sp.]